MSSFRFPAVFFSHGTPMLAFGDDPFFTKLSTFASQMPKPRAIVIMSAHSISSDSVHILSTQKNWIQYDYSGFPKELYQVQYSCPGEPLVAQEVARALQVANFQVHLDSEGPLDHGIWVPLMGLFPDGSVPVVRVSLPLHFTPAQVLKMGHALSKLRENGVLIAGSGGAVHNLGALEWSKKSGPGKEWASRFEEWLIQTLQRKDVDALIGAEENPEYHLAHPSTEHFLPLYFAVGAALPQDELEVIHRGIEYGTLSMLTFCLTGPIHPSKKNEQRPNHLH